VRFRVRLHSRAKRHLAIARAWWRVNRPSAPDAIDEEMQAARKLLSSTPDAGGESEDYPGLRRLLLERVDYHLYYRVDRARMTVEIVAVWHARRLPPLL
jgi:plasmid stabilization system protein ParE